MNPGDWVGGEWQNNKMRKSKENRELTSKENWKVRMETNVIENEQIDKNK